MCDVITKDRIGDERLAGSSNEGKNQGMFFLKWYEYAHTQLKNGHTNVY